MTKFQKTLEVNGQHCVYNQVTGWTDWPATARGVAHKQLPSCTAHSTKWLQPDVHTVTVELNLINMLDPIQKHFGYKDTVAIMAIVQPESGRIIYAWSEFPHPVWFDSSKEGLDPTAQNWSRSDLDGLVRFWANASCPEANSCARIIGPSSGRMQPACTSFPLSDSLKSSTDSPDHTVQNQPRFYCVLADYVRFWPKKSSPEASQCARIIWPALGQHF